MENFKIFVIDDDPFFSYLLQSHLNRKINQNGSDLYEYYEVVSFTNAKSCLAALDEEPIMIIADYNLDKEINGIQLILRAQEVNPVVKYVLMSSNWQNKEEGEKYGIDQFLIKDEDCIYEIEDILMEEVVISDALDIKTKNFVQELSVFAGLAIGILVGITIYVS